MVALGKIKRTGEGFLAWDEQEWVPTLPVQGNHARTWELCTHPSVREVIADGPAGTGKSIASCLLAHYILDHYPGTMALIVRQTRSSLADSWLASYEDEVLRFLGRDDILSTGGQRRNRMEYKYPNGSLLVIGGLDRPTKLYSTSWNFVMVIECQELRSLDPWQKFSRALRWKVGMRGYRHLFLYGECNPSSKSSWIWNRWKKRDDDGFPITYRVKTTHTDNPFFYDTDLKSWTRAGGEYVEKRLRLGLSGVQKRRLYHGEWCAEEGVVYDNWERSRHLVKAHLFQDGHFSDGRKRWVAMADGQPYVMQYTIAVQDYGMSPSHPGAHGILGVDQYGRVWLLEQWYKVGLDSDRWAAIANRTWNKFGYRYIVCDHSIEAIQKLNRLFGALAKRESPPLVKRAWKAPDSVSLGIQFLHRRLDPMMREGEYVVMPDALPGFVVVKDCLAHDPESSLRERGLPTDVVGEFEAYSWDLRFRNDPDAGFKDEPLKDKDHMLDAVRYGVVEIDKGVLSASYDQVPREFAPGTYGAQFPNLARRMRRDLVNVEDGWKVK